MKEVPTLAEFAPRFLDGHARASRYFLRAEGAGEHPLLPGHDTHSARLGKLRKISLRSSVQYAREIALRICLGEDAG
jgi:hypothetical protein